MNSPRSRVRWVTAAAVAGLLGLVGCTSSADGGAPRPTDPPEAGPSPAEVGAVETRWAEMLSGPSNEDEIDGVAAAPDGSVYVTGQFEQSTTLGGEQLLSEGKADIPLARFDAEGNPQWVGQFGGPGEDNLFDIAANEDGAVGTGIFEGTVRFGDVTLTSAGSWDCVIVAVTDEGAVRWATALGGPGPDGCNEVAIGADGSIVTSIDTAGGWDSPAGPLPGPNLRDTLLLSLDDAGEVRWGRRVGGDGAQRGKSLAVGPDGSIAFGGDSVGDLVIDGQEQPVPGSWTDAWFSHWSPEGELGWSRTWGGGGADIVKGLAYEDDAIYAVGSFEGSIDVAGSRFDAGTEADLAVTRFDPSGDLVWATSVRAEGALGGAEVAGSATGGVVFGGPGLAGLAFGSTAGDVALDAENGGWGFLVHYRPDGSVELASTIAGTANAGPDEISRSGDRIYVDIVLRGTDNEAAGRPLPAIRKDGAVWALDLVARPTS